MILMLMTFYWFSPLYLCQIYEFTDIHNSCFIRIKGLYHDFRLVLELTFTKYVNAVCINILLIRKLAYSILRVS